MPINQYLSVLRLTVILAVLCIFSLKADEFDDLLLKWKEQTTGTGYDTADPAVQSRLASIASSGNYYWSSMNTSPARTYLWSDATSTTVSAHLTTTCARLRAMALAYATSGCSLEGNASLLSDTVSALDWMNANRYNSVIAQYDNWWDWEIGVPRQLTDIAVLLYDQLSPSQRTSYMAAVNFHTPVPDMTQANQVWKARVVGVRGCVVKDAAKIALARDAFSDVFPYVTSGDGFYRDGSFVQHSWHPYTAGYGAALLSEIAPLLSWLSGSPWAVTDPAQSNLYQWIYESYEPIIYRGAAWDLVRGREVSRSGSAPQSTGHTIMRSILSISQFAPPADAARMQSMVKDWAQSDTVRSFTGTISLPLLAAANALMNNPAIEPRGELLGHYHFGDMDRVIHLRPGYGFGLSMSSRRIANFESINTENMRGWYTGDGMTILYNADLNHYGDAYQPTIDQYRRPGTTVDTMVRTPPSNPTRANGQSWLSSMSWVGGASLDDIGSAGMQLDAWNSTLTAKKSWFMFEDEIVCLGAGITSTDNRTIETIVENRKLITSGGSNTFTVDDTVKPSTLGWSETLSGVNWAHLAGHVAGTDIGYYFPQTATVKAMREARTGAWSEINANGSTSLITRNYLTLWFDHGSNPANADYSYVLLPNQSVSDVAAYAAAPAVEILENSPRAQGVRKISSGYTAVNFWNSGVNELGGITVDNPSSVIVRSSGVWLDIVVSDPTQTAVTPLTVEIDEEVAGVISLDPGVTVLQLTPTVKLSVDLSSADGRSYRASLYRGPVHTVEISPAADAYVQNGANETNNYGTSWSLVTKTTTSGSLTRQSYLRFDLSDQTNGILAGAALSLVYTTCNGADTHIVAPVDDHSWSETAIVWTNRPAAGAELARWNVQTNVPARIEIPLGSAAKAAVGGLLDLRITAVGGAYVAYASRENSTVMNRPKLILTYVHPPPQVTLSSPAEGRSIHWAEELTLEAGAMAEDCAVTNVSFHDNGMLTGTSAQPPYRALLSNLAPGDHVFTAVAVDETGAIGTSQPIAVTVTGEPMAWDAKALTLAATAVNIDLRPLVAAYATPVDELAYSVSQAVNGVSSILPDQFTARFMPAAGFSGSASFVYAVADRGVDPRLLLHYDMEQESVTPGGMINDATGQGRDGTLDVVGTGIALLTNAAPALLANRQALLMQESGDFNAARIQRLVAGSELDFSDHSWSFSGWFQRTSLANEDFIFYIGNGDGYGGQEELHLYGAPGSDLLILRHYVGEAATDIDLSAGSAPLDEWHHVALTFERTNTASGVISLYLDGVLKAIDDTFTLNLDQSVPIVFGGHQSAGFAVRRWFNGMLDELAVFNAALSADEVAVLAARSVAHFGGPSASGSIAVRVLATAERPVMSDPVVESGGWMMTVNGPTDLTYTFEASTNLIEWIPLDSALTPVPPFQWSDPDASLFPSRFYRIWLTP